MPRIFISYRRIDSHIITGRIHDWLVFAFGEKHIFKDVDDIPPGMDFRIVLWNALDKCDAVLVIIGKDWLNTRDSQGRRRIDLPDDYVRMEIEAALSRDDVLVIPVLVDGAVMPTVDDLPLKLRPLAYRNAVLVRHDPDFQRDMARLIDQLSRIRGKKLPTLAGNKPATPIMRPQATTPEMRYSVEKLIAHLNRPAYAIPSNEVISSPVPALMTDESSMRQIRRIDAQQLTFLGMAFLLTLAVILTLVMLLGQAPQLGINTPAVAQSITETATTHTNYQIRMIPPVVYEADATKTSAPTLTPVPTSTNILLDVTSDVLPQSPWINEATYTARAPFIENAIRRGSTPFSWQVGMRVVVVQDTAIYERPGDWASVVGLLEAGTFLTLRLGRHNGRSLLWYYDADEVWFAVANQNQFGWLPLRFITLPN